MDSSTLCLILRGSIQTEYMQFRGMYPHAAGAIASNGPYAKVMGLKYERHPLPSIVSHDSTLLDLDLSVGEGYLQSSSWSAGEGNVQEIRTQFHRKSSWSRFLRKDQRSRLDLDLEGLSLFVPEGEPIEEKCAEFW